MIRPKAPTIGEQIEELADRATNAYLDEEWRGKAGEAPLQRRVAWVLEELGISRAKYAAAT